MVWNGFTVGMGLKSTSKIGDSVCKVPSPGLSIRFMNSGSTDTGVIKLDIFFWT